MSKKLYTEASVRLLDNSQTCPITLVEVILNGKGRIHGFTEFDLRSFRCGLEDYLEMVAKEFAQNDGIDTDSVKILLCENLKNGKGRVR